MSSARGGTGCGAGLIARLCGAPKHRPALVAAAPPPLETGTEMNEQDVRAIVHTAVLRESQELQRSLSNELRLAGRRLAKVKSGGLIQEPSEMTPSLSQAAGGASPQRAAVTRRATVGNDSTDRLKAVFMPFSLECGQASDTNSESDMVVEEASGTTSAATDVDRSDNEIRSMRESALSILTLVARLEDATTKSQTNQNVPAVDPEKEQLRCTIRELTLESKARSRFGAWVCKKHMEDSDDDAESSARQKELEALRLELGTLQRQVQAARREGSAKQEPGGKARTGTATLAVPKIPPRSALRTPSADGTSSAASSAPGGAHRVRFQGERSVHEAASEAVAGRAGSVRHRVPTTYVQRPDVSDAFVGREVRFQDDLEEDEADTPSSEASEGNTSRSSVRDRVPTSFAQQQGPVQTRGVHFQDGHTEHNAASARAPEGARSSVRERVPTGYVQDPDVFDDRGVHFQEEHTEQQRGQLAWLVNKLSSAWPRPRRLRSWAARPSHLVQV